MKLRTTILVLALLAPAPLVAGASSFSRVDEDANGAITPQEAKSNLKGLSDVHFNKCDADRNGVLDKGEFGCVSMIYDRIYRDR
ncbi:hypothetical protein [Amaricoccus tamworthensis]|uniref:hypothetical protein n=1 Tax=Amaricoccus tamworthensis TaxID=57002 RepID=UPI003C7D144A